MEGVPSHPPAQHGIEATPRFLTLNEATHFAPVLLASYPRSGNSLLRVLLERLTGHITGSDTRPNRKLSRELLDYGLLGEGVVDTSKVWIVKSHFPERFGYKRFTVKKIILLVRNPFDTLDSYFNMVLTSSHTKSLDKSEYDRLHHEWGELVLKETAVWKDFHEYYLFVARESGLPMKVIRYEDLMNRRWHTMRGLLCFLYDLRSLSGTVHEQRIRQLAATERTQQLAAYKPRRGRVDHSLDHFSEEQKAYVVNLTSDLLSYFGYSKYLSLGSKPPFEDACGGSEDHTDHVDAKAEDEATERSKVNKVERRREKEAIVLGILQRLRANPPKIKKGLLDVNLGMPPLREVSPTDPFGRGMSWKKEVLARRPITLEENVPAHSSSTTTEDGSSKEQQHVEKGSGSDQPEGPEL